MGAACSGYPQRVRHELTELIQKQIDNIEKETFGGATDVERREYEEMRKRIDELRREFERFNTAA
jgi:polyhydroxyalkanoate synthesis regulator phasin